MSWQVSLYDPTNGQTVAEVGHTSFLGAAIYRAALGADFREVLHEQPAEGMASLIEVALDEIEGDPDRFRALEPSDRAWPLEYSTAFLDRLREACAAHRAARVRVIGSMDEEVPNG